MTAAGTDDPLPRVTQFRAFETIYRRDKVNRAH